MNKELLTKVENGVGTITFNRPEVMNGLTPDCLHRFIFEHGETA